VVVGPVAVVVGPVAAVVDLVAVAVDLVAVVVVLAVAVVDPSNFFFFDDWLCLKQSERESRSQNSLRSMRSTAAQQNIPRCLQRGSSILWIICFVIKPLLGATQILVL